MGIFFALLAALLASASNFFLRKSIDTGGSSKAYLVVQLTLSFFVMILLNPVRTDNYEWSTPVVILGLLGGIIYGMLMWGMGKTLEKGPPGLSFAVLNTSTVMPGILMALLFGVAFNHPYTLSNGIGSILVVLGLIWAGWTSAHNPHKKTWMMFAAFIFVIHSIFLVFLQWWAMVLKPELPTTSLLPFHLDPNKAQWFMPAIFLVGALIQWIIFLAKRHRFPKGAEIWYGILGGIAQGACTFFLILAPQVAKAWENAMIFPIFAVSIIIICNIWAQALYHEKVNWKANAVCLAGLIIGTVSWSALR